MGVQSLDEIRRAGSRATRGATQVDRLTRLTSWLTHTAYGREQGALAMRVGRTAVPDFGSDRGEADMPRASGAGRSDARL